MACGGGVGMGGRAGRVGGWRGEGRGEICSHWETTLIPEAWALEVACFALGLFPQPGSPAFLVSS